MSALKIALLFGLAGALGLIVAVLMGPSDPTGYLIDASLTSIALGGFFMFVHAVVTLWTDFSRST